MKRLIPFSILCLLLASAPAGAQKRAALQLLRQETKVLPETAVSNASAAVRKAVLAAQITAQMQRAAVSLHAPVSLGPEISSRYKPAFSQEQIKDLPPARRAAVLENALTPQEKELQTSVFSFRRAGDDINILSGFVVEEEFEGRKRLWGVTAAHVAEALGGTQPAIRIPQINIPLSVHFEIRGTSSMADVALFPIPAEMAQTFQPIKLAQEEPRIGEQLRSFGFFNEGFHLVEHREVKEVTPGRIITSLEFNTPNRAGACGGPVLNTRNEAVGMHCGSSDGKQISFVIPAWQIKDMLRAYRNDGRAARPLIFKGVVIGEINIDEAITQIRVFSDGMEIDSFNTHHKEKDVDYAHLEKPLFLAGADRVEFTIFSQSKKKFFRLVYNLETKQIQLLTP